MKEAKLTNAVHIPFEEENADETAKKILETAIENFSKRGKYIYLPRGASPHV
jgi:hydroxylamine reductase (hybrid-cluster protein)